MTYNGSAVCDYLMTICRKTNSSFLQKMENNIYICSVITILQTYYCESVSLNLNKKSGKFHLRRLAECTKRLCRLYLLKYIYQVWCGAYSVRAFQSLLLDKRSTPHFLIL